GPPPQRFVMERAESGKDKVPVFRSGSGAAAYFFELSIAAASYVGLAELALVLPQFNPVPTPLWPPTVLALALVLLRGYRIWPAILAGSFSSCMIAGRSLLESGSVGIGTLLGALAGKWLISCWSHGQRTFDTPASITKFAIISFAPTTMISSLIALAGFILANKPTISDSVVTWLTWWLADAAATLVITPVVVLWGMMSLRLFFKWSVLESFVLLSFVSLIGIVAYSPLIGSNFISSQLGVLLLHRGLLGFLILL